MFAIFKRDFKALFQSIIGYLFIAVNLFLIGIYFYAYNLKSAYPYFSYTISACSYIYMVTIPILTMRILSEEKKNKTDQLLLTSPVSVTKIVLGKFLAVAAVFMILVAIICTYPLVLSMFGQVYPKETYTAILGFTLYGLAAIAIGEFISSITESQIIAAVISFATLFITFLMTSIISLISSTGNLLTTILGVFDVAARFNSLLEGTLDLTSVVYLISVVALMLFLTTQVIQKRRYNVSVKNLRMGAYSTGAIVIFTAAIVFLNLVVGKIPEKYTLFDMTDNQLYSLTNDSKNMLKFIDKDVDIYVYCAKNDFDENIAELLMRYDAESSHVKVTYVDPVTNPTFYLSYSTSAFSSQTVVVQSGDKFRIINYDDMYVYESSINYYTYSYDTNITAIDAEGQLTSAIAYVTGDESHTIYFTSGHGESDLESGYTDLITKANVSTNYITLLMQDGVPEDAECLFINKPTEDFIEDDIAKIRAYVQAGGTVMVSLVATGEETPVLWNFLQEYGLEVSNRIVADSGKSNYYQSPFYLLPSVSYTSYTSNTYGNYYIFAPYSLAMTISENLPDGVSSTALLRTSSSSYAKDITKTLETDKKEDGDIGGPFVIAAISSVSNEDGSTGRLVVSSCSYLFTEEANSMVSGGNKQLFSEILSSLVDIENVVSIPAKSYEVSYLTLTEADIVSWRNISIIVLPAGLMIFGLVSWLRRRKR